MRRLKKSVCTSGFKDWSLDKIIEWAQPLGFNGLELWMGHIDKFQEENGPIDKLKKQIETKGFEVPIISGYTFFSNGFSGEHDMEQEYKRMQRLLDVARQIGSPMVRTFAGHASSRDASPEQWGQMVSNFKKVVELADKYEINIGVEVHYNTFADTAESIKRLMQEVDHPRFKIVFDGANLNFERIPQMEALAELYEWVEHVHLKNYKWDHDNWYKSKAVPVFDGDIDNITLLKELQNRQYNKFISIEYFGEEKIPNIEKSLTQWSNLLLKN